MIVRQNKPKLSQQKISFYVLGYQTNKWHILEAEMKVLQSNGVTWWQAEYIISEML